MPLRVIVARKTPEACQAACKALRRDASRKQKILDPRNLVAADFIILGTSLPQEGYPADEVLAVYRLRWQMELAFKRLKSQLHMDRLPTHTVQACRSWLTSRLILALLCDDASQALLESSPPEDLLDAVYLPTLWRVWGIARHLLLLSVLGNLAINNLLQAATNTHRRPAPSRRKRNHTSNTQGSAYLNAYGAAPLAFLSQVQSP